MTFDITAARKAGYSESEILTHLAGTTKFDLAGARKAGYSDAELLAHMSAMKIQKAAAPAAPLPVGVENPTIRPAAAPEMVPAAYVEEEGPSLAAKALGVGETALTMGTGLVGGAVGGVGGLVGGLAGSIISGEYGTQEGVRNVEQSVADAMSDLTYHPRTDVGKQYAGNVGNVMMQAVPALPLTAEMAAIGRGVGAAATLGRDAGAAGVQRIRAAAPAVAERVERTLRRNPLPEQAAPAAVPFTQEQAARLAQIEAQTRGTPSRRVTAEDGTPLELPGTGPRRLSAEEAAELAELQAARTAADAAPPTPPPGAPTPGTLGSAGSAGTDMSTQRTQNAASMPVPIKLTRGQATRDPDQLRFEQETAKGQQGAPIREFLSEQNEAFHRNFDSMVDMTGAEVAELIDVGRAVESAIVKEAARDKAVIRVAYQKADKSGETAAPVTLTELVEHLNESAPDAATAPLLTTARGRALQLGIAEQTPDGTLVALPTTLRNAERMRQAINRATDFEATNIRQSAIIKGLIDTSTESLGGTLYRSARRLRENFAKKYEDRAVIASLRNKQRGSADRKVALEDIFEETILKGSREDLGHLRRVLQTSGDDGKQAWRELQGATANWIKDQALKNVATDQRGNRIVSAAQMDRAITSLEQGGKLDFIFGKQGAQMMRDLNDLAKVTMTTPPGTVNYSNTASVLLAALTEAGVTGSMTGLPVPVLSALRLVTIHAKNRKIQKRVEQALAGRPADPPTPPAPDPRTLH